MVGEECKYEVRFEVSNAGDSCGIDTYRFSSLAAAREKFQDLRAIISEDVRVAGLEVIADEPDYYAACDPSDRGRMERVALV